MTTYTTRPRETPELEALPQEERRERTSPVLLAALAVALVAAGVWWTTQREATTPSSTSLVVETVPEPATTAVPAATEARGDARAVSARRAERAARAPVVADRAARPLAGNPLPEYPRGSLRSGAEGSVMLSLDIDARGVPVDVQVVQRSGDRDRDFDRAAIEAARQWRFAPAIRDGKAVSSTVRLPVDFRRG